MSDQEKERRRAELVELLRRSMQNQKGHRWDDAFMQADAAAYASAPFTRAEHGRKGGPGARIFVCQACGKANAVLHGAGMTCDCGAWSAAELLPP